MRKDHAEQILEALEPALNITSTRVRDSLLQRIIGVNLKTGKEPQFNSKSDYIDRARAFAKEWLRKNADVCVHDVIEHIPLSYNLPPDLVGGIFRHADFQKVGTRTITMPRGHKPRTKTVNTYVLTGSKPSNLIVSWD